MRVLAFDVNETLLDLTPLNKVFADIFGDVAVRGQWFAQMIANALLTIVTDRYHPFGQVGMAALDMVAARRGVTLTDDQRQQVRQGMVSLPPHPEVRDALESLREAGFRLASLTNSTLAVAQAQLKYAGLDDLFEYILSADTVQRLKPAPEPYHMAAQMFGVPISQVRLIAAHAWDVAGAMKAGAAAAFVARPGMVLDPLMPMPDIVGADLREVAALITKADQAN
jgi:2-haloacid dehalogenase